MNAHRLTLLASLFLFLLAACGSEAPQAAATPIPGITPTATIPDVPRQEVQFLTQDNVQLAGFLFGHGKTAVICSHELGTTKAIWSGTGIPQRLAQRGYMVLAYDFRGYGESARGGNLNFDADLRAAMAFVRQQGATNIVLLGSSMGGTVSLKVASTESVAALITLSAPEYFLPLPLSDDDVRAINGPKLFVNSDDDTYSTDTKGMYNIASDPKKLQMYTGAAHGVEIFSTEHGADLTKLILDFIAQYAPAS